MLIGLGFHLSTCVARDSVAQEAAHCRALKTLNFSNILDAPTYITDAALVGAKSDAVEYCEVHGYVAPSVGFALRLPSTRWNGKLIELGCGGSCGFTEHIAYCQDPLRRGYACIVSDGGHKSDGGEMSWAHGKPGAAIEYFTRASHVTALAGKAVVSHYYNHDPARSYFMGCSSGGIQAMWEAQRYPGDFNGIVAGDPALRLSQSWLNWLWANRALIGKDGESVLGNRELELLHGAVVAQCDMNDGVRDGLIGDPRACHFDPAQLRCAAGQASHCLSAPQVEAVQRIYSGPVDAQGNSLARPMALRGSEISWSDLFGGSSQSPTRLFNYFKDWLHYSIFQIDLGAAWGPEDFDFNRDSRRLAGMEGLQPDNPDLRSFKAAGGKLLAYTGWSDAIEGVLNTTDYYEIAERAMAGRAATQDFFRLFVIPGMNHCTGGEGPFAADYLTYLESWVENHKPPDKIIGSHLQIRTAQALEKGVKFPLDPTTVQFSRPIYPYPVETRYLGHGDPNQATSFGPVSP